VGDSRMVGRVNPGSHHASLSRIMAALSLLAMALR
jgi:hypothetical protein